MKIDFEDQRLTAYLLGELDDAGRREVEQALQESPELAEFLEELKETEQAVSASLQREAASFALTGPQRQKVLSYPDAKQKGTVKPAAEQGNIGKWIWHWLNPPHMGLVGALALLVLLAGLARWWTPSAERDVLSGSAGQTADLNWDKKTTWPAPASPALAGAMRQEQAKVDAPSAKPVASSPQAVVPQNEGVNAYSGGTTASTGELKLGTTNGSGKGTVVATPAPAEQPLALASSVAMGASGSSSTMAAPAMPADADVARGSLNRFAGVIEAAKRTELAGNKQSLGLEKKERFVTGVRALPAQAGVMVSDAQNTYQQVEDNPFQRAADEPLSTFSIDVDTASYSIVRRYLNQGSLPPAAAVRIEEMVNYFSYRYPEPDGAVPFSATVELASCPWNAEHKLARIGIKGREVAAAQRQPLNLVFLIDVSGSMQKENKLPLLKKGLRMLVQKLNERDRVAIVTYAGNSGVALPSTSASQRDRILAVIDSLEAGGSTNGGAGIRLAYESAREHFIKNGINRVILSTDGDFNVGTTDRDELVRLIQQEAGSGIFLSVYGFGMGNLKDATLEQLADKGNGVYGYIDSYAEARKVFSEQVAGTLVTIAKDVKVQIDFNPRRAGAYRLIGYEDRMLKKEDFNNDRKDAGEIGAGHTVTALYEIIPPGKEVDEGGVTPSKYVKFTDTLRELSDAALGTELLTVRLRYKDPQSDSSKLQTFPVRDHDVDYRQASDDFRFASSVALFGMILRDSTYRNESDFNRVLDLARSGKGADEDGYRAEFIHLVQQAAELKK